MAKQPNTPAGVTDAEVDAAARALCALFPEFGDWDDPDNEVIRPMLRGEARRALESAERVRESLSLATVPRKASDKMRMGEIWKRMVAAARLER